MTVRQYTVRLYDKTYIFLIRPVTPLLLYHRLSLSLLDPAPVDRRNDHGFTADHRTLRSSAPSEPPATVEILAISPGIVQA